MCEDKEKTEHNYPAIGINILSVWILLAQSCIGAYSTNATTLHQDSSLLNQLIVAAKCDNRPITYESVQHSSALLVSGPTLCISRFIAPSSLPSPSPLLPLQLALRCQPPLQLHRCSLGRSRSRATPPVHPALPFPPLSGAADQHNWQHLKVRQRRPLAWPILS